MKRDEELQNYKKLVGEKQYNKEYFALYMHAKNSKFRHSKKEYINDEFKLQKIKEKYKNGVTQDIINDMLGIKN